LDSVRGSNTDGATMAATEILHKEISKFMGGTPFEK
jgi:hypothetical protein